MNAVTGIAEKSFRSHPKFPELPVSIQLAVLKLINKDYIHPADIQIHNLSDRKLYYVTFTDKKVDPNISKSAVRLPGVLFPFKLDSVLIVYRTSKGSSWDAPGFNEKELLDFISSSDESKPQ